MESTVNFTRAFSTVFDEMKASMPERDRKLVGSMLIHPACMTKDGRRVNRMRRSHRRVRRMYLKEHNLPMSTALNWDTLVQWIRANWVEIVKAILFIIFLFI